MKSLTNEELLIIRGGFVSGSLVNAFARGINSLLELGRSFGTAIRRINDNKLCRYTR